MNSFQEFFAALHGHEPFPWQSELAKQVCASGEWPAAIDLPTGAGKTACIDVALYHWLLAAREGRAHEASRRIAFVVDRRIIVDEAYDRAKTIADRIAEAAEGPLLEARQILRKATGDAEGRIDVHKLRGGIARERNLVRDPARVSVVLSTVDQMGSRLLFRGYGTSSYAAPLHAGMFGFDTLLLLDEAHIAEPFCQRCRGSFVNRIVQIANCK
ncbi:DEAD/DEAH box helicase family protein [Methanothrix soehngenii]|uniref:DEAD/DEAH box helicase family protein n=1 Tax=Methanothrix soehngenii TaxID=2223 RepID=UPI00300DA4D4